MTVAPPIVDDAQVLVVGAGPAGAAGAAILARAGVDVLILDRDRFPREKPCGDCLTSAAVEFLRRLGLERLIADSRPVEGRRILLDHRAIDLRTFGRENGRPSLARCIRRRSLDAAILEVAQAAGARFRQARVEAPLLEGGYAEGVRVALPGGDAWVRGRYVIAADGAASVLRRACGLTRGESPFVAYAARAYFRTERPLEPLLDFHAPVWVPGRSWLGQGWVFPVDDHVANIGVAVWHAEGSASCGPLLRALDLFVREVQREEGNRLGELEPLGEVGHAPLGVNFSPDRCQFGNVLFVGDAARTTDPLSGQGTANALLGAERVATALVRTLRGGPRPPVGHVLDRRFPRLGQEISLPARVVSRHLDKLALPGSSASPDPLLSALRELLASQEDDPSLEGAAVATAAAAYDGGFPALLEAFNEVVLDDLRTEFPFAREMMHRELRADGGPLAAAVTLAAAGADGSPPKARALHAAVAVELLWLASRFVSQVAEPSRASQPKLNNGLALLFSDFLLGHAVRAATRVDTWLVESLGPTLARLSEAQFQETRDLFDVNRSQERYLLAASGKRGVLISLAAEAGARLAGATDTAASAMRRFGHELGIAFEIARDVVELLAGDAVTAKRPGHDLRHGYYPLPLILALRGDGDLREALGGDLTDDALDGVVERVRRSGAVDAALGALRSRARAARAILGEAGETGAVLRALTELPVTRAEAAATEASPEDAALLTIG